jgi:hypothetical protein
MRKIACWTESFTEAESIDLLRELALSHALRGGVQGAQISHLIRRDDLKALCEFELDLRDPGWDPAELYHCRQAVSFFQKLEGLNLGIDQEAAALKTFDEAEALCRETNEIFRMHARGEFQFPPRVEASLYKAQRKIARMLGPVPTWQQLGYRFGKGATTLTKKRVASIREKFRVGVACSEELLPAANAVLGELPALCSAWASAQCHTEEESWYSVPVVLHDGRLEFVPKNFKTFRATVTEPPLNGLAQLAVGDHMVGRFERFGLNLRDQTRNQSLALEGSLTAALATADQKSASDCKATELVAHLLPLDWFIFLSRLRTGHVLYRGRRIKLEKFSSMGNGFTFPLESVVFYALARSVCEDHETVSVYGDDIIVPTHRFSALAEILRAVGFLPNEKKSYSTGPFRESCGKDYYKGIDVRPYFQKAWVSGETLFTLHNYYKRRGMHEDAARVLAYIHPSLHQFGPDGYGDGHLLGDHPRTRKDRFGRNGWEGTLFNTFSLKGRKDIRPQLESDWVLPVYTTYRNAGTSVFGKELEQESSENLLKLPRGFFRTRRGSPLVGPGQQVSVHVGTHRLRETTPSPMTRLDDGSFTPAADLPLLDKDRQYHKVSIYTLGR